MKCFVAIGCLLALASWSSAQKDPNFQVGRNTIVHLFEWKYKDIAEECERFLQHHGYAGVQVSPVSENLIIENRPWWERYQVISYKLATRSGNEEDFLDMTTRCNAVGIRIYVDAVINHMTGPRENAIGTGGSTADPATKSYPYVPYKAPNFHDDDCQVTETSDADQQRICELLGLKDLDQSFNHTQDKIVGFLNRLIDVGVAGFRIDAARHMYPSDLSNIYDRLRDLNPSFGFPPNSRPYLYQEVIDLGQNQFVTRDDYTSLGAVTEFRAGTILGEIFRGQRPMEDLGKWGEDLGLLPSGDSLAFVDNHDNQRGHGISGDVILTYKEPELYTMAVAFLLAHPYGTTRIMSSFSFEDSNQGPPQDENEVIISPGVDAEGRCTNGWVCEHRWPQMAGMVGFRNVVSGTQVEHWWSNGQGAVAFCRGNKGFVLLSQEPSVELVRTCLPAGTYCDVITGGLVDGQCAGRSVIVDENEEAGIAISAGEDRVLAIHVGAKLA